MKNKIVHRDFFITFINSKRGAAWQLVPALRGARQGAGGKKPVTEI